jgi:hypothetical protein
MTSFVAKFIHETVPATPRLGTTERLARSMRTMSMRAMSTRIGTAYENGRAYEDARDRAARQRLLDGYTAELHRYRF